MKERYEKEGTKPVPIFGLNTIFVTDVVMSFENPIVAKLLDMHMNTFMQQVLNPIFGEK